MSIPKIDELLERLKAMAADEEARKEAARVKRARKASNRLRLQARHIEAQTRTRF